MLRYVCTRKFSCHPIWVCEARLSFRTCARKFNPDPTDFRITSFTCGKDYGKLNLSVDTAQDFARIAAILERSGNRPGTWSELALIAEAIG